MCTLGDSGFFRLDTKLGETPSVRGWWFGTVCDFSFVKVDPPKCGLLQMPTFDNLVWCLSF